MKASLSSLVEPITYGLCSWSWRNTSMDRSDRHFRFLHPVWNALVTLLKSQQKAPGKTRLPASQSCLPPPGNPCRTERGVCGPEEVR